MRNIKLALSIILIVLAGAWPAEAKRVALVVGNSQYQHVPALTNPRNDARDIAEGLRQLGFNEVRHLENLDQSKLLRSLKEFQSISAGAEIALVYFAGHGVEVSGKNYLVPVDSGLKEAGDVEYEAVSLDQVRSAVSRASKLRLIILDACRNNPFKLAQSGGTRSLNRGLAIVDEPSGNELIAYAARAGTVASDGSDQKNSPYAAALLKNISQPGLEVRQLFGRVRDQVVSATGRGQEPFTYGTLGGESIYLNPPKSEQAAPAQQTASNQVSEAAQVWAATRESNSIAVLDAFASSYPDTVYSRMARARIEELKRSASSPPTQDRQSPVILPSPPAQLSKQASVDTSKVGISPQQEAPIKLPEAIRIRPVDDPTFVREIQTELKRVGCEPGSVDGRWGKQAQSALDQFKKYKKIKVTSEEVNEETLKLIKLEEGRMCPLQCDDDEVENNGICIPKRKPVLPVITKPEVKVDSPARSGPTVKQSSCSTPPGRGGDCRGKLMGMTCSDECGRICRWDYGGFSCNR